MKRSVERILQEYDLPGAVVGVLQPTGTVIQNYGHLDVSGSAPTTIDTAYGIGSISKVFTATLAVKLVALGKLDLDQPIINYMANLPLADRDAREVLTMRHLLTHQSGFEGDGFIENGAGEGALREWVEGFDQMDQVTPPGAAWSYSNTGFGLAGYVLAAICDTTYEDAMREHVLKPLRLDRTGFGQEPAFENSATGYEFGDDGSREARPITGCARSANPAGGLVSTVPDLLRFAAFHLGTTGEPEVLFLPADLRLAMQTPQIEVSQIEKWGIGWGIKREGNDIWTIEHGGWFNGFRAQLILLPEIDSALAILTTGPKGHEAIEHIQAVLLADEFSIQSEDEMEYYSGSDPHFTGTYGQSHIHARFEADPANGDLVLYLKTKWHGDNNDDVMVCPLKRLSKTEYVVSEGEFLRSHITFFEEIPGTGTAGARILNRICLPLDNNGD